MESFRCAFFDLELVAEPHSQKNILMWESITHIQLYMCRNSRIGEIVKKLLKNRQ